MIIIANPNSGKGIGKRNIEIVKTYLNSREIPYTLTETNGIGHARELAATASENGEDTVIALGGDGTFHEVLNGIDFDKSRIGFIPSGRGNDFAIGTKVSYLDPKRAISAVLRGIPQDFDYIQVADKRCLNVAGTGLDVEVLLRTANKKNKITYTNALLRCLLHYKPYRMSITVNGTKTVYENCVMVGVCNGTQIGAGIRLSPKSKIDDGKLDIIVMEKPSKCPTVFVMPGFVKGKHLNKPYAHHIVCEEVEVQTPAPIQIDGEIYYGMEFNAHIVKNGVKSFATN